MKWQGGRGGRAVRLFKSGRRRLSPRFHLFVFDVNQRKKGTGYIQDILTWLQEWEDSP